MKGEEKEEKRPNKQQKKLLCPLLIPTSIDDCFWCFVPQILNLPVDTILEVAGYHFIVFIKETVSQEQSLLFSSRLVSSLLVSSLRFFSVSSLWQNKLINVPLGIWNVAEYERFHPRWYPTEHQQPPWTHASLILSKRRTTAINRFSFLSDLSPFLPSSLLVM